MGRFDVSLLDTDGLFQSLITNVVGPDAAVGGDLDVQTFEYLPFVLHSSNASQEGNANSLWSVTLTVHVFAEPATAWPLVQSVYSGIWAWEDPTQGIVPGVGAIESLDQEISAFSRIGGEAQMENKTAIQYTGSWVFTARSY